MLGGWVVSRGVEREGDRGMVVELPSPSCYQDGYDGVRAAAK
jgi:hypothetical protein